MSDSVQIIKERLSIVDVVAPYVELHKAGKNYKGKSPFTQEKTPSFYVSPDKGMYYCFSSSQGGDIFTFIESMEGVDFKGALQILADKAGVELVPEDPKKRSERDTGYTILTEAAQFFCEKLRCRQEAEKYLEGRGVTAETIAKWQIGYAPGPPNGGWRELRNFLKEKKYTDEQLLKAGLVKSAEGPARASGSRAGEKEPYDVFRDRIMFPIFDSTGKVIAFSGRILTKDSEAPKYVNSPETDFFNKSEALYGYDKAKQGIRQYDFSLIVEGQFDVVLSHQAGYTNTVAVSGTALTPYHVGLLQRLSNRVVLALDADRAGIAAVKRAADVMLARGIDLKVARNPDGEDPADIIKDDPKKFKDIIGKATHVIEFLLAVLKEETTDERTYKLRVRDEILPYIVHMQNEIDAEHFEGVVAKAIGARVDSVHLEVIRLREEEAHNTPSHIRSVMENKVEEQPEDSVSRIENLTAYLAVAAGTLGPSIGTVIEREFTKATGKKVDEVVKDLPAQLQSELLFGIEEQFADAKDLIIKDEIGTKLKELSLMSLRNQIKDTKEKLYAAERDVDEVAVEKLLQEVTNLQKALAEAGEDKDLFLQT